MKEKKGLFDFHYKKIGLKKYRRKKFYRIRFWYYFNIYKRKELKELLKK